MNLSGFNAFDDLGSPFATDSGAHFDKLIVMVVDAMRSDFMFSREDSQMHYLHTLIRDGNALPFTAFSHPPTVTLPRLKGITTGGTPSFIDAILNIADDKDQSQGLEKVDSWVHQFKNMKEGRNLHFFGDDTWLKLFPPNKFFERFEGTSSFFVSDFTEVDHNVTRHLQSEIDDNSWDALILHYLGLDHIGHKGGPKSIYMGPKQAEMDSVFERLYKSRVETTENTLLVLLGDHGMNEIGNHGGASPGETNPGFVLASPKFSRMSGNRDAPLARNENYNYYSSMSQIDLVPTLAALFDFPIPKNNLGIILPEVLDLWTDDFSKRTAILENCKQFIDLLGEKYSKTDTRLKAFLEEFQYLVDNHEPLESYYSFLKQIQSLLIQESTNYSYLDIACGFFVILISSLFFWSDMLRSSLEDWKYGSKVYLFFAVFSFLYSLHFHGSSLIEEEHQIWWYLTVAVLVVHWIISKLQFTALIGFSILFIRIIRGWNDSGQKVVSDLTISKFLVLNPSVNWVLVLVTYIFVSMQIHNHEFWAQFYEASDVKSLQSKLKLSNFFQLAFVVFISILSFSFKVSQFSVDGYKIPFWLESLHLFVCELFGISDLNEKKDLQLMNVQISRLFFYGLFTIFSVRIILGKFGIYKDDLIKNIVNIATLFLMHQTRVETIPIFLIFAFLKIVYSSLFSKIKVLEPKVKIVLLSLFTLCLQHLSFFSVGNTNLLATVDLSNAYNGVSEYNVLLVGILTFVSNFSVVIYWSLAATDLLCEESLRRQTAISLRSLIHLRARLNLAFYSISALNLVGSCINLRFHLFIWSVFSPKLLYFGVWVILINFTLDFIGSSFLSMI